MKILVVGAGWYGCHIATSLIEEGHDVTVFESSDHIFAGASGNIPARLHLGFHYPRSHITRAACLDHNDEFMRRYGEYTSSVPVNVYAIANHHSNLDFGAYLEFIRNIPHIQIYAPFEFGLQHVEGAVLTGERHVVPGLAKEMFEKKLASRIQFGAPTGVAIRNDDWDWVIDCTFCANHSAGVDRYEPCLVLLLSGPTDRAVTIMDGPFPSLYPWDEELGLSSLSSAKLGPFRKDCATYGEARAVLDCTPEGDIRQRGEDMVQSMAYFYPAIADYNVVEYRTSIRAMPLSAADTRLADVARVSRNQVRVRAGKIDAIFAAERLVKEIIKCPSA